jgi:uncharacterized spore protein YtfJ
MSLAQLFASWIEPLQSAANVKSVFGEPIEAQGRTIIPVARVSFGFGAGEPKAKSEEEADEPGAKSVGGGGGARSRPLGVLEVTAEGTRFIPTRSNSKLYAGIAAGVLIGLWLARGRKK